MLKYGVIIDINELVAININRHQIDKLRICFQLQKNNQSILI